VIETQFGPESSTAAGTSTETVAVSVAGTVGDRDVALAGAFADLAGGLVGDLDVHDLLHTLSEHCVGLLDMTACGVLLADSRGTLSLLAAFPQSAGVLEDLQVQDDEGPCFDSFHSGEAVCIADLAADAGRWPNWAPKAIDEGVRTVYATPIRTRETVIGTLNLFGHTPQAMPPRDLLIVRALADVACITIMQQRRTDQAGVLTSQLQTALETRVRIEQAKGIVAQALSVGMDTAFQILRHSSRTTNTRLTVLAEHLISGRIAAGDLLPLPAAG